MGEVLRHPIHPMLVSLPIGLWVFSLGRDLVFVLGSGNDTWATVSFYAMVGGVVGALAAAVPGVIGMLSLHEGLRRAALTHMAINLAVVALYLVNLWLRARGMDVRTGVWLSAPGGSSPPPGPVVPLRGAKTCFDGGGATDRDRATRFGFLARQINSRYAISAQIRISSSKTPVSS